MEFNLLVLSNQRVDGLKNLLDSIKEAYANSKSFKKIRVILGVNNDTEEVMEQKKELIKGYDTLDISIVYPDGNRMDSLRTSMWHEIYPTLLKDQFYMWIDDDDLLLPNFFTELEDLMEDNIQYYQVGEKCHYTQKHDWVTRVVESKDIRTNEYMDVFDPYPYYRVSVTHGEIYNVGLSEFIYDHPINVHACEDSLPSLRYYELLKEDKNARMKLTSVPCIEITPSDRLYDLNEWAYSVAKISSSLDFIKDEDCRRREAERLVKYLVYNAFHHKKFDYENVPWL